MVHKKEKVGNFKTRLLSRIPCFKTNDTQNSLFSFMFMWLQPPLIRNWVYMSYQTGPVTLHSSQTISSLLNSITAIIQIFLQVHTALFSLFLYIWNHLDILISEGKFCHYVELGTEINPLQIFWSISWPI